MTATSSWPEAREPDGLHGACDPRADSAAPGDWRQGSSGVRGLLVATAPGLARTLDWGITVCAFVAAGLLRFDTLGRHMGENWRDFGLAQAEPDARAGLFQWEEGFYGRSLSAGERVLVAGCGSGRDLLPLLARGCLAEGLEAVTTCADLARARVAGAGFSAPVRTGDIATAALGGPYDVVIFSWLCYSYIPVRATSLSATTA